MEIQKQTELYPLWDSQYLNSSVYSFLHALHGDTCAFSASHRYNHNTACRLQYDQENR